MRFGVIIAAALLAIAAAGATIAFAQFPVAMMSAGGTIKKAPLSVQLIASIQMSGLSFPPGAATGTAVGTASVTMSPTTPVFNGQLSLSSAGGGDISDFAINATSGAVTTVTNNLCSSPPCSYTLNVVATQSGLSNSPQSQTFTVMSSSGISAPAAATAGCQTVNGGGPNNGSCFNNLVGNWDFTGQTAFGSQPANYYQTLSNFLDCAGASSPQWYNSGGTPCSDISIVNDGGITALHLNVTTTDQNNGVAPSLQTAPTGSSVTPSAGSAANVILAPTYYIQFIMRKESNTGNTIAGSFSFHPTNFIYNGSNANTICGSSSCSIPDFEYDYLEAVGTNEDEGAAIENSPSGEYWPGGCYSVSGGIMPPTGCAANVNGPIPGYNNTQYNSYGYRLTTDGLGNAERCFYFTAGTGGTGNAGSQLGCMHICPSQGGGTNCDTSFLSDGSPYDRLVQILFTGPKGGPPVLANTYGLYVAKVQIWTCASPYGGFNSYNSGTNTWTTNTGPCQGAVITSNP